VIFKPGLPSNLRGGATADRTKAAAHQSNAMPPASTSNRSPALFIDLLFAPALRACLKSTKNVGGHQMPRASTLSTLAVFAAASIATSSPVSASTYKVVYAFKDSHRGGDGSLPAAGLLNVRGTLYGTTYGGGAYKKGTVFAVNPAAGDETIVYAFKGEKHGVQPIADLIKVGAKLYGTTSRGGVSGYGTVFEVPPATAREKVVYPFTGGSDGATPSAGLINVGGTLYGTVTAGGANNWGAVIAVSPATGAETVVYSFQANQNNIGDGLYPYAGLLDVGGTLYGTTFEGGPVNLNDGTVFAVNPATGAETVVYAFTGAADGAGPKAGLIDFNGLLYGTTQQGGADNVGTVFAVNPATGAETTVYTFTNGADGGRPEGGLLKFNGKLYGTTEWGGAYGTGVVFAVNPATGKEKVVHSFQGFRAEDGADPEAGLINVGGTFYGTTNRGGIAGCGSGCGTVFAITP
jgi:uncharacterized repeat protein (TIGR03803 family)